MPHRQLPEPLQILPNRQVGRDTVKKAVDLLFKRARVLVRNLQSPCTRFGNAAIPFTRESVAFPVRNGRFTLELFRDSLRVEIIAEEAPWAFGYTANKLEVWQPYVHGYRPNPVLSQHVRFAWIDGGGRPTRSALNLLERALPLANRPRTTLAIAQRGSP